jgi:peptidoglycan hydrolase-like protein with peptidoglycan-binding domain
VGRLGPAFLVSDNFYVLKRYNESDLYALFIGQVSDRLRGSAAVTPRWPSQTGLTRADVRAVQERLQAAGHDVGRVDGLVGFATRVAIGRWQRGRGMPETCFLTQDLAKAIQESAP